MITDSENKLSRVLWRCRRGMLELDVMLQGFCNQVFGLLDPPQQQLFEDLLEEADQDLHRWLVAAQPCENPKFQDLLLVIRHLHVMNKDRQPA